ncbi:MAG: hypothetical protein PHD32_02370 [Eubacteriales bacterium]|nr:hypothetical protein [Eubacteriales bacterium]
MADPAAYGMNNLKKGGGSRFFFADTPKKFASLIEKPFDPW